MIPIRLKSNLADRLDLFHEETKVPKNTIVQISLNKFINEYESSNIKNEFREFISTMKKTKIKTFKQFMKEEQEKYYTLDLYSDMTKEDVIFNMNELLPYILKMLKNSDVTISVVPNIESEEE
jgi:predicted DNA-binding protein